MWDEERARFEAAMERFIRELQAPDGAGRAMIASARNYAAQVRAVAPQDDDALHRILDPSDGYAGFAQFLVKAGATAPNAGQRQAFDKLAQIHRENPEAFEALVRPLASERPASVAGLAEACLAGVGAFTPIYDGNALNALRLALQGTLMRLWPDSWIELGLLIRRKACMEFLGRDVPAKVTGENIADGCAADLDIGAAMRDSLRRVGFEDADMPMVADLLRARFGRNASPAPDAPPAEIPVAHSLPQPEAPAMPLNTILYGPPGTGKTFATAERAVMICDGAVHPDREDLMARYTFLEEQGRIAFVTFHQSYGYEDFVEGLRPQTGPSDDAGGVSSEEPAEAGPGFSLVPVDGVLKRMARRAAEARPHDEDLSALRSKTVFKISLGPNVASADPIRERCFAEGRIMFGVADPVDFSDPRYVEFSEVLARLRQTDPELSGHSSAAVEPWLLRGAIREGDIALASAGTTGIHAIGEVVGPYEFDEEEAASNGYMHQRRVRWLRIFDRPLDAQEIYDGLLHRATLRRLARDKIKWERLASLIGDEDAPPPPHVLIIDEINRANVSKVMGELITLLEDDKREGAPNAVSVTLPFSGERFSLPGNLHILGTMNTADRSIALLDTALRRRFHFEHLAPEPDLLGEVEGADLGAALRAMNDRLEWLLGPDHLIGHAWLMGAQTLAEADLAMRDKIIPLLREYFHEDLSRVRAVLGGGDGFLRAEALSPPPGLDDGYETRFRYRDAWEDGYGAAAWAELIG